MSWQQTNKLDHGERSSTLKKISDAKFPHKLSHVNLREVSPKPDIIDMRLETFSNDLFLKLYRYSYCRWKEKHLKRSLGTNKKGQRFFTSIRSRSNKLDELGELVL